MTAMRVYTHPACLLHDTGPGHAESPQRLRAVTDGLRNAFPQQLDWREAPRASRGQLLRAHAPELLDIVLETRPRGRALLDPDTVLSPDSDEAALRAAGAAVAAVDAALLGPSPRVFCAVRPQAIRYLNRLSDLLFVLARVLARASGHGEVLWNHDRRK